MGWQKLLRFIITCKGRGTPFTAFTSLCGKHSTDDLKGLIYCDPGCHSHHHSDNNHSDVTMIEMLCWFRSDTGVWPDDRHAVSCQSQKTAVWEYDRCGKAEILCGFHTMEAGGHLQCHRTRDCSKPTSTLHPHSHQKPRRDTHCPTLAEEGAVEPGI